jgi:glutamyl-Q tRNA(Asp) synthetase
MRVSRFAPSPTGLLHLGHAFSAIKASEAAGDGRFLLRIEDIDQGRARAEFETAIFDDLAWLGLHWDEPPRRQSEHMAEYVSMLDTLIARGLVYRCFRTRKELAAESASAPHGLPEPFTGAPLSADEEHARLARSEAFAWRLHQARCRDVVDYARLRFVETGEGPNGERGEINANPALLGDVVVARKDFPTSYHLAACHDDAQSGVTIIARGQDLFYATHLHVMLQTLLGWQTPEYRHHRLILGPDGKRLAKRDHAATLRGLREAGKTPSDIRAMLG